MGFERRGFGGRRDFGERPPKKKYKIVCSECKEEKEVELPFEPQEGKPICCTECWKKKKGY